MKKFVIAAAVASLTLGLSACGSTADESSTSKSSIAEPKSSTAKPKKKSAAQVRDDNTRAWCVSAGTVLKKALESVSNEPNAFRRAGFLLGAGEGLHRNASSLDLNPEVHAATKTLHSAYVQGMQAVDAESLVGVADALDKNAKGWKQLGDACGNLAV